MFNIYRVVNFSNLIQLWLTPFVSATANSFTTMKKICGMNYQCRSAVVYKSSHVYSQSCVDKIMQCSLSRRNNINLHSRQIRDILKALTSISLSTWDWKISPTRAIMLRQISDCMKHISLKVITRMLFNDWHHYP